MIFEQKMAEKVENSKNKSNLAIAVVVLGRESIIFIPQILSHFIQFVHHMSQLSCITWPLYKSACRCSCQIRQLRVQFSSRQVLHWTLSPSFWEVYKTKILYKWSQVTTFFELSGMEQYSEVLLSMHGFYEEAMSYV